MTSTALYLLEMMEPGEDAKLWYVGVTSDPDRRRYEHDRGCGSQWTTRKELIEMYVLGEFSRTMAKEYENLVTGLLGRLYHPLRARGGRHTGKDGTPGYRPGSLPEVVRDRLNEILDRDVEDVRPFSNDDW